MYVVQEFCYETEYWIFSAGECAFEMSPVNFVHICGNASYSTWPHSTKSQVMAPNDVSYPNIVREEHSLFCSSHFSLLLD